MPSALQFLGGGLLTGLGKGLKETGVEKRERQLKKFEQENRLAVEDRRSANRREEIGLTAGFRSSEGLLQRESDRENLELRLDSLEERTDRLIEGRATRGAASDTSAERQAGAAATGTDKRARQLEKFKRGQQTERLDAAGERNRASIASREKVAAAKGKTADSSAAEKRAFDSLVKINTVPDDNGIETTDWNAVADGLEAKGFGKLAKSARSRGQGITDRKNRAIAKEQAAAEADEKSGIFTSNATAFKKDGGSRTRFVARREREIFADLSGKSAAKKDEFLQIKNGGEPYVGDKPPSDFPDAIKANDGFWYVKRDGNGKVR